MKGLVELLGGLGYTLSGSDAQEAPESLRSWMRRGFVFHRGHAAEQLPPDAVAVVYSLAVGLENPERQAASERGLPQFTYSQVLGALMAVRSGVCIAGTHGKSTTTALTAGVLSEGGRNPSAIFGANLARLGTNSWAGAGEFFVVESCEFRGSFLDLTPKYAAILNVEPDHFDCYPDMESLVAAFGAFAAKVDPAGFLLVRHDDHAALEATRQARAAVMTFGTQPDADWWVCDVRRTAWGSRGRLFRRGQFVTEWQLPLPGRHNVSNALVAAAIGVELGVSTREIRASLAEFPGLQRRFEPRGSYRGVTLLDDYAHHPTAVEATLQTAREVFGDRTIRIAFQPHQVLRTERLLTEFAQAFYWADEVVVTPVYAARERVTTEPWELSERLAGAIRQLGVSAQAVTSLDHATSVLEDELRPGDVVLTMGAGDIDRIHHAFTRRVFRDPSAGRTAGPVHLAEGGGAGPILSHSA